MIQDKEGDFHPYGKQLWKMISMEALKSAPKFVAIMMNLQNEL